MTRHRTTWRAPLAAWCLGTVVGFLPQAAASLWLNGSLTPVGGSALTFPTLQQIYAVLLSTGYEGWISWTPIVLPSILGLVLLTGRAHSPNVRTLAAAGLVAIVAMVAIDVVHPFGAGASFGGRRYVSTAPLLTLGLGALLAAPQWRLSSWKLVLPALAVWNVWLLTSYELLTIVHDVYPTLTEATGYAVGMGAP